MAKQHAWLGALALLVAVLVAVLGTVWLAWPAAAPPPSPADAELKSVVRVAEAALTAPPPAASAASAAAVLPEAPSSEPKAVADPRVPGSHNVCGLGPVAPGMSEAEIEKLKQSFEGPAARQAIERLLDSMASRSARHQMAALALRAQMQAERDMNQGMPDCSNHDPACAASMARWHARREATYAGFAQQAAQLAFSSREPMTYALASQLCSLSGKQAPPDCGGGLLRAWTAQQPENAAAWLLLSADERQRGNLQAAEDAVYRASQAHGWDDQSGAVIGLLTAPEFGAEGGLAAGQLHAQWSTVSMGLGMTALGAAAQGCKVEAVRDANRWQRCESLTQLMISQAPDMLARLVGRRLAKNLGWPAERVQALDDHALALQQMQTRLVMAEAEPFSCAALQRQQQRARAIAEKGEVAYLEGRMRAQGLNHQQLADELRAQRAQASQQHVTEQAHAASAPQR